MDPAGIVIGAVGLLVAGAVAHLATVAAARGAIEVNAAIGIRTRHTTASQPAWQAAHAAAEGLTRLAFRLATACAVLGVVALVTVDPAGSARPVPGLVLAVGYVGLVGAMVAATVAANRAAREVRDGPDRGRSQ